jgi:hypothetical protein
MAHAVVPHPSSGVPLLALDIVWNSGIMDGRKAGLGLDWGDERKKVHAQASCCGAEKSLERAMAVVMRTMRLLRAVTPKILADETGLIVSVMPCSAVTLVASTLRL